MINRSFITKQVKSIIVILLAMLFLQFCAEKAASVVQNTEFSFLRISAPSLSLPTPFLWLLKQYA